MYVSYYKRQLEFAKIFLNTLQRKTEHAYSTMKN